MRLYMLDFHQMVSSQAVWIGQRKVLLNNSTFLSLQPLMRKSMEIQRSFSLPLWKAHFQNTQLLLSFTFPRKPSSLKLMAVWIHTQLLRDHHCTHWGSVLWSSNNGGGYDLVKVGRSERWNLWILLSPPPPKKKSKWNCIVLIFGILDFCQTHQQLWPNARLLVKGLWYSLGSPGQSQGYLGQLLGLTCPPAHPLQPPTPP